MHTLQITGEITAIEAVRIIQGGHSEAYHVCKTQIHGSRDMRAVVFDEYGNVVAIANIEG